MFFSSKLKQFKNIKHCFFSRKNGVSKGLYESLNCGSGSNDKKENIVNNLSFVSNRIGCKKDSLITLNQKHTNQVIHFQNEKNVENKLSGDAIVTKIKNLGISILTADCAPILFYDPVNKIIGCAHAGWRGALDGIIENTVSKFNQLNSINEKLIVVVGPCIGKENYIVENDFVEKFLDRDSANKKFFSKKNEKKYIFDLRNYINNKILNLNIKNVENIEKDTFSEKDFFYSYRRSRLNGEKDYGRCISVILMT